MNLELVAAGQSIRGWSNQGATMTCPQQWAYREMLRLREHYVADPLARGVLVHAGLAQYWEHRKRVLYGEDATMLMDPINAVTAVAHLEDEARIADNLQPGYRAHIPDAKRAMELYLQLRPHDATLEPHAVEWPGECWFHEGRLVAAPPDAEERRAYAQAKDWRAFYACGAPWLSTFRADIFGRRVMSGRHVALDWKTGAQMNEKKRRGFGVSGQFVQLALWGAEHFTDFEGVIVGFVHMGNIGKGNRNVEDVFPSFFAPVGVGAIRAFPWSVQHRAETIARLLEKNTDLNAWPRAFTEQGPCEDRYGPCAYMRPCMD